MRSRPRGLAILKVPWLRARAARGIGERRLDHPPFSQPCFTVSAWNRLYDTPSASARETLSALHHRHRPAVARSEKNHRLHAAVRLPAKVDAGRRILGAEVGNRSIPAFVPLGLLGTRSLQRLEQRFDAHRILLPAGSVRPG